MKRIVSLLLAAVLTVGCAFVLSSCGSDASSAAGGKDVLKVGLECAYAPFNWTQVDDSNNAVKIDGSNQYANGYDVQIARKVAEALGKELVVVKCTWEGLLPGVQSGAFDMIIAGMSLLGTLAGSFGGIYVSGSLTQYRLRQLEEKVNRHNNLIERTFRLEQECAVLEERVRAADRRIDGLEEEQA